MHVKIAALMMACALAGCAVPGADRSGETLSRRGARPLDVGFVLYDHAGAHLYLKLDRLGADDTLSLQYFSASGGTQCCRVLTGDAAKISSTAETRVSDEDAGASLFHYRIGREAHQVPFVGVVTVNAENVTQQSDGSHLTARTGAGQLEVLTCQSNEGIHLFAKQASKRVSHLYYALDYEVTPSCPAELFESQEPGDAS